MNNRDRVIRHDRFKVNRGVPSRNRAGKLTYERRPGYWKPATCEDMQCHEYENGWVSSVSTDNLEMLDAIYEVQKEGTWEFTEERVDDGKGGVLIRFSFPPGQTCFKHLDGTGHMVPVDRDPVFLHQPGGRPTKPVRMDYDEFFTRFNETSYQAQGKLKEV